MRLTLIAGQWGWGQEPRLGWTRNGSLPMAIIRSSDLSKDERYRNLSAIILPQSVAAWPASIQRSPCQPLTRTEERFGSIGQTATKTRRKKGSRKR